MNTDQKECFYHTALCKIGLVRPGALYGDRDLRKMLQAYGSFEEIYNKSMDSLNPQQRAKLKTFERFSENLESTISKHQFGVLRMGDDYFPRSLRAIEYATPVIYVKGDVTHFLSKSMAVVGTRELDIQADVDAGKDALRRLIAKGFTIVSGLAKGCDTLAHTEAVNAPGGKTIAVLGTPLDQHYPAVNHILQDRIAKDHLLVSQYPIGIRSFPAYFAHRNITTAGLATDGLVVITAGDHSGTQHAIRECVRQGKQLYLLENIIKKGYKWPSSYFGKFKIVHKGGDQNLS